MMRLYLGRFVRIRIFKYFIVRDIELIIFLYLF